MILKSLYYKLLRAYALFTRNTNYTLYYSQFNTDFLARKKGIQKQARFKNLHKKFLEENAQEIKNIVSYLEKTYKVKIPLKFINDMALTTQISVKKSEPNFYHGYVLYAIIANLAKKEKIINIFETGTAKGFSSLCMAKALEDNKAYGKIVTVDILPVHQKIYWNSALDEKGKTSRKDLLLPWKQLVEKYIIFLQSYTDLAAKQLLIPRIHAAFIDAQHEYKPVILELSYTSRHQKKGDIIICDDYHKKKFPEVVQAINDFIKKHKYSIEVINPGKDKYQNYALLTKK